MASTPRPLPAGFEERKTVIIGSRKSDLAMWQARYVQGVLSAAYPQLAFEIRTEVSTGDVVLGQHLATLAAANPGLFTKELEVGLLSRAYDLAVHSLKDMPTTLPPGLALVGISEREDPRDAFVASASCADRVKCLSDLPPGAVVGTSSLRREAMLKRVRGLPPREGAPEEGGSGATGVHVRMIRGNLNTRVAKLDGMHARPAGSDGSGSGGSGALTSNPSQPPPASSSSSSSSVPEEKYDALILASAGLKRLGWGHRISSYLSAPDWGYGVGQGALGIEIRDDDGPLKELILGSGVVEARSAVATLAERTFLNRLQGGCQVPIAVHSWWDDVGRDWWEAREAAGVGGLVGTHASAASAPSSTGVCVRTLTLEGTMLSVDGSSCLTVLASTPVELPPAAAALEGGSTPVTLAQWDALSAAATSLGAALASKALASGAEDILGPIVGAIPRPITYGAAEERLD